MPSYTSEDRPRPDSRYKRPTTTPGRVNEWAQWKEGIKAKDEAKLGRGKKCPVAVDLMNLQYDPLPAQARFHACNTKHKGFSGPVGSGKSKALAYEAIYLSAISPNSIGYITAPTHSMLRDAAQLALRQALDDEGIEYEYRGGEFNMLSFKSGDPNFDATNGRLTPSQIYFRTASHPDRLRGPNIAWFGMDEMTYSDADAWDVLIGRIRDPRANQHNGFGCWTPKGYDWVYKLMVDPESKLIKSGIAQMIYSSPRENFHLPSDYYDTATSQYDELFARQEIGGEYLSVFQGQVYHAFLNKENVRPLDYIPGLPVAWTLDFNVNPFCSSLLQYVDGPNQARLPGNRSIKPWAEIWAFDEIVLRDGNTYKMCEEFGKRMEPLIQRNKNRIDIQLYGDATGARRQTSAYEDDWRIIRNWFVEHKEDFNLHWYVEKQNPPVRSRVNAVNAALCDASGIRHLRIDPRCTTLINDLQSVSWRQGDEGTNMDEGKKRELTHASDALGYYITQVAGYAEMVDYVRKRMDGF